MINSITQLITMPEGKTLEFKRDMSAPKNILKTLVAFEKDIYDGEYFRDLKLNERQIKAVMHVKEKGQITNKEYQEICNTSERTASRDLLYLVSLGFFEQIGTTGAGTAYILKGPCRTTMGS